MKKIDLPETFRLTEYEEKIIEEIDTDTAQRILSTGIVDITRKVSGEFILKADSKVGFVSASGIQVNVNPRFPIYNIFYLLGLTRELKFDLKKVFIEQSSDFLTILFQSFFQSVSDATKKGLVRDYVNLESTTSVLRGRVDFGRQLKRQFGAMFPLEVSFDDFLEDIPENRILKRALRISLKFGVLNNNLRSFAQGILYGFKDVGDIESIQSWVPSRLNSHYWDALKLAELIISGNGFSENLGNVQINGFSIEMHKVFEDFVAKQLVLRAKRDEESVITQKRLALDFAENYFEKPDIIWYRHGKPFKVIDTKYKKPDGNSEQRDSMNDLRQVISYASLLELREAHIIYGVAGDARTIKTRQEGITVFTHGLDLGKSPAEIESQLDSIVEKLRFDSSL